MGIRFTFQHWEIRDAMEKYGMIAKDIVIPFFGQMHPTPMETLPSLSFGVAKKREMIKRVVVTFLFQNLSDHNTINHIFRVIKIKRNHYA